MENKKIQNIIFGVAFVVIIVVSIFVTSCSDETAKASYSMPTSTYVAHYLGGN